jgi:MCP family monocarboxylic acid transporter-like MFS transporter 10
MCVLRSFVQKRRFTALGIAAFASSVGGTVFPVVFRNSVDAVGFAHVVNLRLTVQLRISIVSNGR